MRQRLVGIVAGLAIAFAGTASARAQVVFDNGSFSGDQIGRFNSGIFTMYDDFTLSSGATITGFEWEQHDSNATVTSTLITVFDGTPSAGTLIFSSSFVPTRTPNANPLLFGSYAGFDYAVSGLNLALGPGTYFLGIHNDLSSGETTWDETVGNGSTIPGRFQSDSPPNAGNFFEGEDSSFRVIGAAGSAAAPEPASLLLVGLGILPMVGRQRRRK